MTVFTILENFITMRQKEPCLRRKYVDFQKMLSDPCLNIAENVLAFTGSSYLFHRLSADNINAERKRHDAATEALQKAQIEWTHKCQQRIDFINNELRLERKAETKFTELNDAMREYHEVFGDELPPLPREPVLSDFYTPSNEQHYRKLGFIALSMIGIGGVLYYFES